MSKKLLVQGQAKAQGIVQDCPRHAMKQASHEVATFGQLLESQM